MKSCGYIDKYEVKKNKSCYILLRGELKKNQLNQKIKKT